MLSNKNKLIVNISALMLLGLIASTLIAYQQVKSQQQISIQTELSLKVKYISTELNHWIDSAVEHVEHYAVHLMSGAVPLSSRPKLNHYSGLHTERLAVEHLGYILDKNGYYEIENWQPPEDYNARERPWYKSGKQAGQSHISHPYLSVSDNKSYWLAITVPLFEDSQFAGLASGHVKLEYIQNIITGMDLNMHSDAFFVDCDGKMFFPNSSELGRAWSKFLVKNQLPLDSGVSLSLYNADGYYFYIPKYYPELDGFLVFAISKQQISNELYNDTFALLAKFLVVFILVVIGLYFANRTVLVPIFDYMELDSVTLLPSKKHFKQLLEKNFLLPNKQGRLLIINIENYSRLTATYPAAQIHILQNKIKERITNQLDEHSLLGNFSESRYIAYTEFSSEVNDDLLHKLTQVLSEHYDISGNEIYCGFRIGVSDYPEHGTEIETLIDNAFSALAHVSRDDGSNFGVFSPVFNQNFSDAQNIQNAIKKALHHGEFSLVFQPQVESITKYTFAVESLVRWYSTELERQVSPAEFIPIAEASGIIIPLGDYIVDRVLAQLAQWQQQQVAIEMVSINVSPKQLLAEDFYSKLMAKVNYYRVSAKKVELEITETSLLENPQATIAVLNQLHQQGFSIAIDDFGTGYSSLEYLNTMPLNKLKIDRSFIVDLADKPKSEALVKAIIYMAYSLGLDVLAEGVETDKEVQKLLALGCYKIQGYIYAKPLTSEQLLEYLAK